MQKQIARWNPARHVWETEGESILCGHSAPYSETWPASGMTRNGQAYELPTSAPRTSGSASSYSPPAATLLKTPTSQLAVNGGSQHPDKRKAGGHGPTLADEIEHTLPAPTAADPSPSLLPTPRASDGPNGGPNQRGSKGDYALPGIGNLLPTPTTQDAKNNGGPSQFNRNTPPLNTQVLMLPTPMTSDAKGTGPADMGRNSPQLRAVNQLLPTPVASPSGNTPEEHLRKKPGRQVVTDLAILTENGLLETGGKLLRTPCAAEAEGGPRNPHRLGATMRLSDQIREELNGETTNPPSADGKPSSDDQLPGQLSLLDAMDPNG